jgi:hypothetical protein
MNMRRISDRPSAPITWVTHLLDLKNDAMAVTVTVCGQPIMKLGRGHYFVCGPGLSDVNCLRCKAAGGV